MYEAGALTWDAFVATVTGALSAVRTVIGTAADVAVSRVLRMPPVGHVARDLSARDAASVVTVTEDPEKAPDRLEQFTRATCGQYASDALVDAMREHGIARYSWTLGGSDDCFECHTREGEIFSVDDGWEEVHPHCDCFPTPIVKEVRP